jgi:hypothetical protein
MYYFKRNFSFYGVMYKRGKAYPLGKAELREAIAANALRDEDAEAAELKKKYTKEDAEKVSAKTEEDSSNKKATAVEVPKPQRKRRTRKNG